MPLTHTGKRSGCSVLCSLKFFKVCIWAAQQITRQHSRCDRTSDHMISFITEGGTHAEHFFDIAMPFPIMEIMWSIWSDQDSKLSNLTPSNLVLVTCSTDIPSMVRLRAGVVVRTFLLPLTIHLVLAVFSTVGFYVLNCRNISIFSCKIQSNVLQHLYCLKWDQWHSFFPDHFFSFCVCDCLH